MIDLATTPLIYLDVETTGFSAVKDRITEVAAIRVQSGIEVQRFASFVKIDEPVPEHITKITGITDNDLKDAPTFEQLVPILEHIFEGGVIVAHNAKFDVSFLKAGFIRTGKQFNYPALCTKLLSDVLCRQLPGHKLQNLIDHYGFSYGERHRAYDDAYVLVQFIDRMKLDHPFDLLQREAQRIVA